MPTLEMLPTAGSPALGLMAWLMTYAVHSTLLGAGVWLATTLLRGHALRETLWKAALIGGLLTTTLQVGLGMEPLGGRLVLPAPAGVAEAAVPATDPEPAGAAATAGFLPAVRTIAGAAIATGGADHSATPRPMALHPETRSATAISLLEDAPGTLFPSLSWGHLLLLAWLAGAAFSLVRMLRGRRCFLAGLGRRLPVKNPEILDSLTRLCRKAGVGRRIRLTRSARLTSPVALGRDEICVPDRALSELSRDQQESMLAHELAHLTRRDPLWLMVSGVIESLFFFQPLNRLSRTHLQESSEFLCDEWAVLHTGRRRTLAHCLAQVASWLEHTPHPAALAPMARLGSPLLRRIQNLLQSNPATATPRTPRRLAMAAMLPLLAVAALAPAVSGEGRQAESAPQEGIPAAPAPAADDDGRDSRSMERDERRRQQDEMRQLRDDMRRVQREMSRELTRAQRNLQQDVRHQREQMRRRERDRALAYQEQGRALQAEQRHEAMELLQREMAGNRSRDMEEMERQMQEFQRRLEDLQQEMMRWMEEMEESAGGAAPAPPLAYLAPATPPVPYAVAPAPYPMLAPVPYAVTPDSYPVLAAPLPPLPYAPVPAPPPVSPAPRPPVPDDDPAPSATPSPDDPT